MNVKAGDVVEMESGQVLKFEKVDPRGQFVAKVKSMKTNKWTQFRIQGESIKLPLFLRQQNAKIVDPSLHPDPRGKST